jgi:NTP pyrophosphatase (non-canonical NTP hydrolase)
MSYKEMELKVLQWGEARGIVQNGKPLGQARKTLEEAGELLEACAKLSVVKSDEALEEAKDAIGDVLVTLIMCAATLDVDVTECLIQAYNEIKHRRGYLRADGVFVKDAA